MIAGLEEILLEERPEHVLAQGDTNSVLAGAIATSKLDISLGHVEAGLRNFDREMSEEINRILADHVSDYLFPPTDRSAQLLADEGIAGDHVIITGNTIVDAVLENRHLAEQKSSVIERCDLTSDEFCLLTAHRAENVDNPERFRNLLIGASEVTERTGHAVIYPIHPRARSNIDEFGLDIPSNIQLMDPVDFLEFLQLEDSARLIFTDSGGVQEEACILQIPCITLRDNTERPETIEVGANTLVGTDPEQIIAGAESVFNTSQSWKTPFGAGLRQKKY